MQSKPVCFSFLFSVALLFSVSFGSVASAAAWYVDKDNSGPEDGTLWATPFTDIQSGVDAALAAGGGEVWVAEGTYTATTNPVVTMKDGVRLYGGFTGNEPARTNRNWKVHDTIIDGENTRRAVARILKHGRVALRWTVIGGNAAV